jgi:hypothetical protein
MTLAGCSVVRTSTKVCYTNLTKDSLLTCSVSRIHLRTRKARCYSNFIVIPKTVFPMAAEKWYNNIQFVWYLGMLAQLAILKYRCSKGENA